MSKRKPRMNQREKAAISAELRWKFVRDQKASGIKPGALLPSTKEIVSKYGVTLAIARDLYEQLKQEGVVEAQKGKGVFLKQELNTLSETPTTTPLQGLKLGIVARIEYENPQHIYNRANLVTQEVERQNNANKGTTKLYNLGSQYEVTIDILEAIKTDHPDGLILLSPTNELAESNLKRLLMLNIPVVIVGYKTSSTHSVLFNHFDASHKATSYLLENDISNLGFIQTDYDVFWATERLTGFCESLSEKNQAINNKLIFKLEKGHPVDTIQQQKKEIVDQLLKHHCQGIVCSGAEYAAGIMEELQSRNLGIPADLSIISVGDDINHRHLNITTAQQSKVILGHTAYELIAEVIANKPESYIERRIDCPLIIRETT